MSSCEENIKALCWARKTLRSLSLRYWWFALLDRWFALFLFGVEGRALLPSRQRGVETCFGNLGRNLPFNVFIQVRLPKGRTLIRRSSILFNGCAPITKLELPMASPKLFHPQCLTIFGWLIPCLAVWIHRKRFLNNQGFGIWSYSCLPRGALSIFDPNQSKKRTLKLKLVENMIQHLPKFSFFSPPVRWGLLDFMWAVLLLLLLLLLLPLLLPLLRLLLAVIFAIIFASCGQRQISTWSSRLQWAAPDLNSELQIAVGSAGPQQRAPDCSGQRRTSSAGLRSGLGNAGPHPGSSRAEWAAPDLSCQKICQIYVRNMSEKNVRRYVTKNVRRYVNRNVRKYARRNVRRYVNRNVR